jgi:type IV pilus assembly protein PilY1
MKPMHVSSRSTLRPFIGGCALLGMLLMHGAGMAQSAMEIVNVPPFLPTPAAPNIVLTFDDSGSMRWAYAPDSLCSEHATRRVKSAAYNPLYYNPSVVYDPPLKYDAASNSYSVYTTSFTAAYVNGFYPSHGTVDLSSRFRPTWSKDPSTSTQSESSGAPSCSSNSEKLRNNFAPNPAQEYQLPPQPDQRYSGVPAYYYVYDTTLAACTSPALSNDNCYRRVVVSTTSGPGGKDERENFANWYSFYRTRNLMTATAATRALQDVPVTARVAWQSLNSCNGTTSSSPGRLFDSSCTGWSSTNYDKRIREFKGAHRENLFSWLSRFPANGGTPLREATSRAGEYFRTTGVSSPYAQDPQVSLGTAPHPLSCRPNFHILMTDGIWNDSLGNFCSGSRCSNADNASRTLPTPDPKLGVKKYDYTPRAPYRDSNGDSVADVAFHYWATDLQPNLTNNLMPYWADREGTDDEKFWNPKNDPATWQHMVTFTVGLGLGRTFTAPGLPWGGGTHEGTGYANLLAGTPWPATGADVSPGNVYDLWHAAINSRGQSFSADTPVELSRALATALNRILERQSAAAALTANSTRLSTGTLLFQARFFSGTWMGSLTAYPIDTDGVIGPVRWEATASGKIPTHDRRNIFTWSGAAGIAFDESSLTTAGLWTHIDSAALLNYLRGDKSNEYPSGAKYRSRSSPIGDIINSDPAFVYAENFGYRALPEGSTYPTFVAAKKARAKMLYVGSNDGMLRAVNADTGEEKFAYVPNEVIPNLAELARRDYGHRFYVDGSPTAWDAHFGSDGWKTILTGTTGAGGKSVFALDVTDPDAFSASKVLWEINQSTPQRTGETVDPQYGTRLGYTIGQAVVVKLNNGEWVAIFGNGYRNSVEAGAASAEASLYIVRLSDGKLIRRIDTGVAGTADEPNGLGTPTLYDVDGDEVYDVVYAADNRGHVWKFDLTSTNPVSWRIAFDSASGFPNGQPLFRARSASGEVQPISARLELAAPPPGKPGIMVVFGTGRFFAGKDSSSLAANAQSFYGIWDNGSPVTEPKRDTALQKQRVLGTRTVTRVDPVTKVSEQIGVRDLSAEPVDWSAKRGWFIDLPDAGERVIGAAAVRGGRVIFTTQVPSTDPCEFGGSGWLMEVSATTGAKLPYSVFDTSGDKLVTTADELVSGLKLTVGMVKTPLVIEGTPFAVKVLSGTSGSVQVERNRTFGPPLGRESWRELRR